MAVIRNDQGDLIKNQTINAKISIILGELEGDSVYEEEHAATTNDRGMINLIIGEGNPKLNGCH